MTDAVWISIISGTFLFLTSLVGAIFSYLSKRHSEKADMQSASAEKQAKAAHDAVNSRMDDFKKLFEEAFLAKGVIQEKEAQRVRDEIKDVGP